LEQEFIDFYEEYIKDDEIQLLKEELLLLNDKEEALKKLSTYLNTLKMRRKRAKKVKKASKKRRISIFEATYNLYIV
jgi:hypothetical protein